MSPFVDKPDANDLLSASQVDIQGNFRYLQAALNKDHQIIFGDTAATPFEGRHRMVSLLDQVTDPALPADGEAGFLYAKGMDVFWRNAAAIIQLTGGALTVVGADISVTMTGGLSIKAGTFAANPNTTTTHNFATAFTTIVYTLVTSSSNANPNLIDAGIYRSAVGLSNFTVASKNTGTWGVNYIAIGI